MEKQKLQLEKALLDAQRTHAEDSGWKWFLGFSVSIFTAVIGGFVAVADIQHKKAEIRQIQNKLNAAQMVSSSLANPA